MLRNSSVTVRLAGWLPLPPARQTSKEAGLVGRKTPEASRGGISPTSAQFVYTCLWSNWHGLDGFRLSTVLSLKFTKLIYVWQCLIRREEREKRNQRLYSKWSRAPDRSHTSASLLLKSELQVGNVCVWTGKGSDFHYKAICTLDSINCQKQRRLGT